MANLVVNRCTQGLGVGPVSRRLVAQRSGNRALYLGHVIMRKAINFIGGQAGLDKWRQVVEYLGCQFSCHSHAFNTGGVFVSNAHGLIIPLL